MKINIITKIRAGAWGGGNQFLKALRKYFDTNGLYTEDIREADIVLFNSFQNAFDAIWLRILYPGKVFVHRVDGPIRLVRGFDGEMDHVVFSLNNGLANGTIFQSMWSLKRSAELGMNINLPHTIIHNAPDEDIFYSKKEDRNIENKDNKIKIIATSWSNNYKKGFDYYTYLDKHLNRDRYEMSFVGRSPVTFEYIKDYGPLEQTEMARLLTNSDIYITASKDDPCSNALIEALSIGLPVVALDSGGNTELVGGGGELFLTEEEMLRKIDIVAKNIDLYKQNTPSYKMDQIGRAYLSFFSLVLSTEKHNKFLIIKNACLTGLKVTLIYLLFKIRNLIKKLFSKKI
ncbi:MAG: glycosyltransferase [Candidatus Paceibacterota bacterium]|jgi:glycosyltransferase involved in cell wall biosynthesis